MYDKILLGIISTSAFISSILNFRCEKSFSGVFWTVVCVIAVVNFLETNEWKWFELWVDKQLEYNTL